MLSRRDDPRTPSSLQAARHPAHHARAWIGRDRRAVASNEPPIHAAHDLIPVTCGIVTRSERVG